MTSKEKVKEQVNNLNMRVSGKKSHILPSMSAPLIHAATSPSVLSELVSLPPACCTRLNWRRAVVSLFLLSVLFYVFQQPASVQLQPASGHRQPGQATSQSSSSSRIDGGAQAGRSKPHPASGKPSVAKRQPGHGPTHPARKAA